MTIAWEWGWLIGGLTLAVAEMLVPGVFLIWLGAAAFVTGLATLVLPLPLAGQLALFAALAVAMVFAGRHYAEKSPIISDDPLLNERTARLVGQNVVVTAAIEGGEGRVRVGDGEWLAHGPDAGVGERVRVVGARGGRLEVERVERLG